MLAQRFWYKTQRNKNAYLVSMFDTHRYDYQLDGVLDWTSKLKRVQGETVVPFQRRNQLR